jgi:hypothetical protein
MPGADFGKFSEIPSDAGQKNRNFLQKIPISIGELEIRDASIILKSGGMDFPLPVSMNIKPVVKKDDEQLPAYDVHCRLHPKLTGLFPGFRCESQIDVHAVYDMATSDADLRLTLSDTDIGYKGVCLQNFQGDIPLVINVARKGNVIRMNFNRLCVTSPFPVELSIDEDSPFCVQLAKDGLNAEGRINVLFRKELMDDDSRFQMKLEQTESLPLHVKGEKEGERWRFSLNTSGLSNPLNFHGEAEHIAVKPASLSVDGEGRGASGDFQFAADLSTIRYTSGNSQITIPRFSVSGDALVGGAGGYSIKGIVQTADAEFVSEKFRAGKIEAKIPFEWPYPSVKKEDVLFRDDKDRYFNICEMSYSGVNIGTIAAEPYQDGAGLRYAGLFKELFPGLRVNFTGMVGYDDKNNFVSKVDFHCAEPGKLLQCELPRFAPQLTGLSFEGNVNITGSCSFTGDDMTSAGVITMQNAKISVPRSRMAIEGIDVNLHIKDFLNFRSEPDQILSFRRFAWGDIEMTGGEAVFVVESASSLFLKRSSFLWCGGHVYTHGLHLKSDSEGVDVICYCDRLKLATILQQFHLADAEGEGAVNGRIPVSYKDGKLTINDGFLYSTPGEGGTIRFDTDTLIPDAAGAGQSIQMQIAHEALKNFTYDWAKLSLQSAGEDFFVRLQMDGRPAGLLPFGFNTKFGLVKVEGEPRAHFQGILFHFNFRLPLDKMLYYGTGMSDLLQSQ